MEVLLRGWLQYKTNIKVMMQWLGRRGALFESLLLSLLTSLSLMNDDAERPGNAQLHFWKSYLSRRCNIFPQLWQGGTLWQRWE